jgi:hypothetical protein
MNKLTMMAAVAALSVSAGAYAQSNNTLATPSTVSPAAAATNSGYGTPGAGNSDSGSGSSNASMSNGANPGTATPAAPAAGVNNTLATPSVRSPVAQ